MKAMALILLACILGLFVVVFGSCSHEEKEPPSAITDPATHIPMAAVMANPGSPTPLAREVGAPSVPAPFAHLRFKRKRQVPMPPIFATLEDAITANVPGVVWAGTRNELGLAHGDWYAVRNGAPVVKWTCRDGRITGSTVLAVQ